MIMQIGYVTNISKVEEAKTLNGGKEKKIQLSGAATKYLFNGCNQGSILSILMMRQGTIAKRKPRSYRRWIISSQEGQNVRNIAT